MASASVSDERIAWRLLQFLCFEAGTLYRSATFRQAMLDGVVQQHKIRTVLNLRGAEPGERWYNLEREILQARDVTLIDFPMLDYRVPSPAQMSELLSILRTATRPLLIHCEVGADRTRLACALFEVEVMGRSPEVRVDS